ncbi:amidohydrolase family protein [candidate division KSB1 bacterium]|nr:amidohydrolase family protein [candidate division KSB1 bacterium]
MTTNTTQKTLDNCWHTLLLIFLTSVLLHPKPGISQGATAELVLINGKILTMDNVESLVSAVKIVDGRLVAIGDSLGDIDPSAQIIDLNGRTVTPGLIDSHIHYFRDSHVPGYLFSDIETAFTIPDLLEALTKRTASVPAGEFITAFGRLRAEQFAENRLPTLEELDSAAPNHPVYLHVSFDGPAVTNTLGNTFFQANGVSVNGSGTFNRGQTATAVQALFNEYSNEDALRTVREYMQFSASLGLTTIQNFSGCGGFGGQVGQDILCEGNYYDLWQQGELRVRIRTAAGATGVNTDANGIYQIVPNTEAALQELQNLGGGDNWLDFTTTGEFVVGGFGDTGAPFSDAYLQIAERGWSLRQHSISNGENDAHISAFEAVNATIPIADLRWALEHVFSITGNDISRLKDIGAGVTVQNQQYLLGRSGPPYRDLVDSGIPVGGGTDASAISPLTPWVSLYHMVSGRVASGAVANAGQQITRLEALRTYTTGSAWYTFDEADLGSIEVGKLADLVVLSDDYLTVPEEEIRNLSSVLTIIGGEVVHAAAEYADLLTSVRDLSSLVIPETPVLTQNYPNPFNPATQIQFDLPAASDIRLTVFDLLGRQVQVLAEGHYPAGMHAVTFDATDLASGLYLYELKTHTGRLVGKMLLTR